MPKLAGYLKVESNNPSDFKGDSKDKDHRDWIEVVDVSVASAFVQDRGRGRQRPAGQVKGSGLSTYTLFISKSEKRAPAGSQFMGLSPTPFASVVLHRFEFGEAAAGGFITSEGPVEEFAIDFETAYYRPGSASLPKAASLNFNPGNTKKALDTLKKLRDA
jgi:hypothetical protein